MPLTPNALQQLQRNFSFCKWFGCAVCAHINPEGRTIFNFFFRENLFVNTDDVRHFHNFVIRFSHQRQRQATTAVTTNANSDNHTVSLRHWQTTQWRDIWGHSKLATQTNDQNKLHEFTWHFVFFSAQFLLFRSTAKEFAHGSTSHTVVRKWIRWGTGVEKCLSICHTVFRSGSGAPQKPQVELHSTQHNTVVLVDGDDPSEICSSWCLANFTCAR